MTTAPREKETVLMNGPIRDPVTPLRTSHSGPFVQDTCPPFGNFHLVISVNGLLKHYWRDNAMPPLPWHAGPVIPHLPLPALGPVVAPTDIELTRPMVGDINGADASRLQMIARFGSRLEQYDFDPDRQTWGDPAELLVDGQPVFATGHPALAPTRSATYELLIPTEGRLLHVWTSRVSGNRSWLPGAVVPCEPADLSDAADVALISSRFHNLEAVVRVHGRRTFEGDRLVFYYVDDAHQAPRWNGPFEIVADGAPIMGVTGRPAFIQSTFGTVGNFELIVPQGNQLVHYWRDNGARGFPWHRAGPLPGFGKPLPGWQPVPRSIALLQSNLATPGNLEVVVVMQDPRGQFLASYSFDGAHARWRGPLEVGADGSLVAGSALAF